MEWKYEKINLLEGRCNKWDGEGIWVKKGNWGEKWKFEWKGKFVKNGKFRGDKRILHLKRDKENFKLKKLKEGNFRKKGKF